MGKVYHQCEVDDVFLDLMSNWIFCGTLDIHAGVLLYFQRLWDLFKLFKLANQGETINVFFNWCDKVYYILEIFLYNINDSIEIECILTVVAYVVNAYLYTNTIIALTYPFLYTLRGN